MIVTVTFNPAVDHTIQVDAMPAPGAVARTDEAQFDAGGKGINVSQYLVGLGTETVATGLVGDFLGEYIRTELDAEGIPNDLVEIEGHTRLNTTILSEDGEFKINHDGPAVDGAVVEDSIDTIARHDPEIVLIAGSLPPGLGPEAIDRVAGAGEWDAVVDVGGATLQQLDAEYALCKPNRAELAAATDRPVESVEDCLAAADELHEQGFERVVASLGADGALLAGDARLHADALDVEVADTVGAGDAMLAGILSELVDGNDERAALRRGVAVASRVVAKPGTNVPSFDALAAASDRVELTEYGS
ncbi:fructose-1-phosphate kinase [Natronoarchaeum philippinense]|uniref:Fructose-1-phosphate kinase n=1 Tax=Natronoarchaeum philippinense TaxID=558529 RepID=A0A285NSM2_NATPI|nr:1-phosphofructokinase [Natronoarchaeum philippinense]SNZ12500.1 fructose-1-phosphate kinase [Natronoarchaeum philippinense]